MGHNEAIVVLSEIGLNLMGFQNKQSIDKNLVKNKK